MAVEFRTEAEAELLLLLPPSALLLCCIPALNVLLAAVCEVRGRCEKKVVATAVAGV